MWSWKKKRFFFEKCLNLQVCSESDNLTNNNSQGGMLMSAERAFVQSYLGEDIWTPLASLVPRYQLTQKSYELPTIIPIFSSQNESPRIKSIVITPIYIIPCSWDCFLKQHMQMTELDNYSKQVSVALLKDECYNYD